MAIHPICSLSGGTYSIRRGKRRVLRRTEYKRERSSVPEKQNIY